MNGEIAIRELRPSDRRAVAFAFGRLSERSRYQRFFTVRPDLSARDLARLTGVDHWHHEALIAHSAPPRAPIGIARYVRLEDFEAAEVAIEVVDEWQRRGVGTALLAALTQRARAAGIRRFHISMLRDNAAARALVRHVGVPDSGRSAGNVVELCVDIAPLATARRDHRDRTRLAARDRAGLAEGDHELRLQPGAALAVSPDAGSRRGPRMDPQNDGAALLGARTG
jgi:GNAT superfamily N-acetyltransferase